MNKNSAILKKTIDVFNKIKIYFIENKDSSKKYLLRIASLFFLSGLIYSLYENPEILSKIQQDQIWIMILLIIPAAMVVNSFEYLLTTKFLSGNYISLKESLTVTIISSAANMLPLPGGVIVRLSAMISHKIKAKTASYMIFMMALAWVAVALIVAGISLLIVTHQSYTFLVLLCGGIVMSITYIAMKILIKSHTNVILLYLQRISIVFFEAIRMYVCFHAIGIKVNLSEAGLFVLGSLAGSIVSIVPAGLGIREIVTATISPLVGITASSGFLAASLNRLLDFITIAPIAWFLSNKK